MKIRTHEKLRYSRLRKDKISRAAVAGNCKIALMRMQLVAVFHLDVYGDFQTESNGVYKTFQNRNQRVAVPTTYLASVEIANGRGFLFIRWSSNRRRQPSSHKDLS